MADGDLYFLVQWEDRFVSIILPKDVKQPQKESSQYQEGEVIQATFQKKVYNAVISEIHPNKKFLQQQLQMPLKYEYHRQANKNTGHEKSVQGKNVLSPPGMSPLSVELPLPQKKTQGKEGTSSEKEKAGNNASCVVEEARSGGWEDECRSLRRKIRRMEERITALEGQNTTVEDPELLAIEHLSDPQEVLVTLAKTIFTVEELRTHSRTGKMTSKCTDSPRPPLAPSKLSKLERLVRKKTGISRELFNKKLENLQKVIRRK